jgi:hypothetical protein
MPEDLLHHPRVINDGDDPHGVLANGTTERVHVPDPEDEVAPAFGGQGGRQSSLSTPLASAKR